MLTRLSITRLSRFPQKKKNSPSIYVSMTTLPNRISSSHFRLVIDCILRQSMSPTKIVLNIPHVYKRTGETYSIPSWVTKHNRIIVNRCEDVGPATKVLGGLKVVPRDAYMIVVDDDIIYRPHVFMNMWKTIKKSPQSLVANSKDTLTGFSGYIVHRKLLDGLENTIPPTSCYFVDDIWLEWCYKKLSIPIIFGNTNVFQTVLDVEKTDLHPKWFELCSHTDRLQHEMECKSALYGLSNYTQYGHTENLNTSYQIPRQIHLTYKTVNLPSKYVQNVSEWERVTRWTINIYGNEDVYAFFLQHFPQYYADVQRIKIGAVLADVFRYGVLYIKGGMYTDMDTVPYRSVPEEWRKYKAIVGYEYQPSKFPGIVGYTGDAEICQWTLFSARGYVLFKDALDNCMKNLKEINFEIEGVENILKLTGPHLFTELVNKYKNDPELLILDADYFGCPKIPVSENSLVMHEFHGWKPGGWAFEQLIHSGK